MMSQHHRAVYGPDGETPLADGGAETDDDLYVPGEPGSGKYFNVPAYHQSQPAIQSQSGNNSPMITSKDRLSNSLNQV